jgi:hypothetical protein
MWHVLMSHSCARTKTNLKVIVKPQKELKVDNKYFERCARRGDGTEVERLRRRYLSLKELRVLPHALGLRDYCYK